MTAIFDCDCGQRDSSVSPKHIFSFGRVLQKPVRLVYLKTTDPKYAIRLRLEEIYRLTQRRYRKSTMKFVMSLK